MIQTELDNRLEEKLRHDITERILREAELERQVAAALAAAARPSSNNLVRGIKALFKRLPESEWRNYIDTVVNTIAKR